MTDPASVKPGEVWAVEPPEGHEGSWIGVRRAACAWLLICTEDPGNTWLTDSEVRLLHRLVPARPVTRDDLPDVDSLSRSHDATETFVRSGMWGVIDAVVEHLNSSGGVPSRGERQDVAALGLAFEAERDRAERLERERDEAVARAEKAEKANRVGDDMIRQAQTEMMRALGRADRAEARVRELEADERLARNPHVVDRVRSVIDAGRDADVQVDLDAGDDRPAVTYVELLRAITPHTCCGREATKAIARAVWELLAPDPDPDPDADARECWRSSDGDWGDLPEGVRQAWRDEAAS